MVLGSLVIGLIAETKQADGGTALVEEQALGQRRRHAHVV